MNEKINDITTTDQNPPIVDMLLSRNVEKTLDSETMILETQKRV